MGLSIRVTREFRNKNDAGRRLDTNYLNTMTVLAGQRQASAFSEARGWVVFSANDRSVVRTVSFSRQFHEDENRLCIDAGMARELRLKDDGDVTFRQLCLSDRLRPRLWFASLPPALKIALWFAFAGVIASAILGVALTEIVDWLSA